MKAKPTKGPMAASSTHHDREAINSRASFSISHHHAALRKRKEHLFEIPCGYRIRGMYERRQFGEGSLAAHPAAAEQHEAIADSRCIGNLMNRQEQRAPA